MKLKNTLQKVEKQWDYKLGADYNKPHSVGMWVSTRSQYFYLYDKEYFHKKLSEYESASNFSKDDIFILSFDLSSHILSINHNGNQAIQLSLKNCTQIIPAFCIYCLNEEIEIIKYEFC